MTRWELPRVLQWKEHRPEGQETRVWVPALPQTSKSPPRPVSSSIKVRSRKHQVLFEHEELFCRANTFLPARGSISNASFTVCSSGRPQGLPQSQPRSLSYALPEVRVGGRSLRMSLVSASGLET